MQELDTLRIMTPLEVKTLEGQKILPILGATAALPGAGLVYSGSAGAPFFAAALASVAAAYLFWLLTDAFYYQQLLVRKLRLRRMARAPLERAAFANQKAMIVYTIAAILFTLAGFAGTHGNFRLPVTVGQGFVLLTPLLALMIAHGLCAESKRNRVFKRVRALKERDEANAFPVRDRRTRA